MTQRATPRLTPRRRNGLWALAIGAIVSGAALLPRDVDVQIEPRREQERPYWKGRLGRPSVRDGGFFLQTLINRYPSPPLPFPHRIPPYRVRFTMHLRAMEAGSYHFELDSPWDGTLDVSGKRVFGSGPFAPGSGREGGIELEPGIHGASLVVQPAGDADVPIRLLWREPGGRLRPFDESDVVVPERRLALAPLERLSAPLLASGVILFLAVTLLWAFQIENPRPGDALLAAVLLAAIAFAARAARFDTYPRTNIDETHNAWAGFNLVHEGSPRSWSWLPAYPRNTRVMWFSYEYPVVDPSFDHPPLLPLLTGLEATALGARSMYDCRLPVIRPMMIFLGTASVVALFLAARSLTGFGTSFLAALLMATSPLVVFGSREVKEDNLVAFFLLLGLLSYLVGRRDAGSRWPWMTGVFSGLAALSKVMGIAVGFALSAAALGERRRGPSVRILASTLVLASLYPLYGLAIDGEIYGRVISHLSIDYSRDGFADKVLVLPRLILEPKLSAVTPLLDGWIVLGWLSLFRLSRLRPIPVVVVSYLLILMLSVSSRYLWGFYLAPIFPFLCLATALQLRQTLLRQDPLSIFLMVGLAFLPQYAILSGAPMPFGFRGLLFLTALPLLPALFRLPADHFARKASRVMLAALLVISIAANLHRCLTTL
jgi:hypothetical protein